MVGTVERISPIRCEPGYWSAISTSSPAPSPRVVGGVPTRRARLRHQAALLASTVVQRPLREGWRAGLWTNQLSRKSPTRRGQAEGLPAPARVNRRGSEVSDEGCSERADGDLRRRGQQSFDLVVQLDQGQRCTGHVQRGAVFADVAAANGDALVH